MDTGPCVAAERLVSPGAGRRSCVPSLSSPGPQPLIVSLSNYLTISPPEEWLLHQRDCRASLAMAVRAKPAAHKTATLLDNSEYMFVYCIHHVKYQPSPEVPKGRSRPPRQHQNRKSLSRATIVRPFLSGVVIPVTQRQSTRCVLRDPSVVNGSSGQKSLA